MVVILRGIKKIDFVDSKTGDRIKGTRLYFEYEEHGVNGFCSDTKYFSDDDIQLPVLELNHKYDFVYDITLKGGKSFAKLVDVKKIN